MDPFSAAAAILSILTAVVAIVTAIRRSGAAEARIEEKLRNCASKIEVEQLHRRVDKRVSPDQLTSHCSVQHKALEADLSHIRDHLESSTARHASYNALREKVEEHLSHVTQRTDAIVERVHERIDSGVNERNGLARDLSVLQNGVSALLEAKAETEHHVVRLLGESRRREDIDSTMKDALEKLDGRVHQLELSLVRMEARNG